MQRTKVQVTNTFTGRWKVTSLYCYVQGKGWILFERYRNKSFVWEFEDIHKIQFPTGSIVYGGKLKEYLKCSDQEPTEYTWYPSDKLLYIDRSDYEPDGFMNICINDRYRVEQIRKNECWLYDLEDVGNEPRDYKFRIKIKKIQ